MNTKKVKYGAMAMGLLNALTVSSALAWGPERTTFTMAEPATYPTFNSITDNPTIGDERDFVRVGEIDAEVTELKNEVKVEAGKKYLVYVYYHNNASATFNTAEQNRSGVAFETKMAVTFDREVTPENKGKVTATVMANNSNPGAVWDEAYLTIDEGAVTLKYVDGSAKIYNDWGTNGSVLSTNLFTEEGTYLGLNALDGVILGCEEYHGVVTYQLLAEAKEVPVVPDDPEEEKTCVTNPEMEGCQELPNTGPLEIVMAAIIVLGIAGGCYYWYRTRKTLKQTTAMTMGESPEKTEEDSSQKPDNMVK